MRNRQQRGSVLATVLMLTMLLAIITAVVASNTLQNYKTTNWSSGAGTSRYIAYAGIQHAMIKLRNNPEYNESFDGSVPGREGFIYRVTVKNQRNMEPPKAGKTDATFRFNTKEVPVNCAKIESRVMLAENAENKKVERSLSGMIGTAVYKPTNFKNAASARTTIMMTGDSKTRAYDFWVYKDGAREAQSTMSYDGYINPDPAAVEDEKEDKDDKDDHHDDHKVVKGSADVATSTLMQIGDTSKVEGHVIMPAQETSSSDGDSFTRGDTSTSAAAQAAAAMANMRETLAEIDPELANAMASIGTEPKKDINYTGEQKRPEATVAKKAAAPPYDKSEANQVLSDFPSSKKKDSYGVEYWDAMTLEPKAYKSVTVPAGQKLKLRPGRYYFADNFQVDGEIEVDDWNRGDVVIYVGRNMIVNSGGRVNFQGDPAQVQVYFTDEDYKKDATGEDILVDGKGNKVAGFSHLKMAPDSKATMVAQGNNLIATVDKARLLGSVSAEAVWLKNGASIEYDTNLADRQMAGASPWRLQGVYETVGR